MRNLFGVVTGRDYAHGFEIFKRDNVFLYVSPLQNGSTHDKKGYLVECD